MKVAIDAMRRAIWLLGAALLIAVTLAAGCTIPIGTGPIDLIDQGNTAELTDATDGRGYVYVPSGVSGTTPTVSGVVYGSSASAPAGYVPAVGATVTASSAGATAAQAGGTVGADGFFTIGVNGSTNVTITINFANATPAWVQSVGTITGPAPGTLEFFTAGFYSVNKDIASVSMADRIQSVKTIEAEITVNNTSGAAATVDLWLSSTSGLTIGDLFDASGDPVSMASVDAKLSSVESLGLYHAVGVTVPAGRHVLKIEPSDIDNLAALKALMNPNVGVVDGKKVISLYATSRPTGTGVVLEAATISLVVDAKLADAVGAKTAESAIAIEFVD